MTDKRVNLRCDEIIWDKLNIGIAEFFGTSVLLFVACMGCVPTLESELFPAQSALISGLAAMIAIFLFGHISGAHVNPLTSVCAVIVGQITVDLLPIYLVGQFTGAITGYGLLKLVTPYDRMTVTNGTHGVCTTVPHPTMTTSQALTAEILFSVILSFANCASWDPKNVDKVDSSPLKFGFLIATLIMAGGSYTGAGMNPFKSFAPALWNYDYERHWIYWVGPLFSALVTSYCYKYLFLKGKTCKDEKGYRGCCF